MMRRRVDATVYNPDGKLMLIVEAKTKLGTSPEWAAAIRSNLLAPGGLPTTDFLLLVTPDRFYLWAYQGNDPIEVEPTVSEEASQALEPYFKKAHIEPNQIQHTAFELLVGQWLDEVAHSDKAPEWMKKTGLFDAIRGGSIQLEQAA